VLPVVFGCKIRANHTNGGLGSLQDRGIRWMLVDCGNVTKATAQQAGYEILADQPGGARNDDALVLR
jgi:hypothetical protein